MSSFLCNKFDNIANERDGKGVIVSAVVKAATSVRNVPRSSSFHYNVYCQMEQQSTRNQLLCADIQQNINILSFLVI